MSRSSKHGLSKTREYFVYHDMLQRCFNPSCRAYKNYGARGIFVCDEHNTAKQALTTPSPLDALLREGE